MTLLQSCTLKGWLTLNIVLLVRQTSATNVPLDQQLLAFLQEVVRSGPQRAGNANASVMFGTIGYQMDFAAVSQCVKIV